MGRPLLPHKFIKYFMLLIFVPLCFACSTEFSPCSAADTVSSDKIVSSALEDVRLYQIGAHEIVMEISGQSLPLPLPVKDEKSACTLLFRHTRFLTDKESRHNAGDYIRVNAEDGEVSKWERVFDLPHVSKISISVCQNGEIIIRITGDCFFDIKKLSGIEGTDKLRFMLTEHTEHISVKKKKAARKLLKGDPASVCEPVTIEARSINLRDMFRTFAKIRGYNMIIMPTVPETRVSTTFRNLPFSEAFLSILQMYNLKYLYNGSTLVIGTAENIDSTFGKKTTKEYKIAYADLSRLSAIITELVPLAKKPVLDERSRSVYIEATEKQHENIEALIEKADSPGHQILIEARLVEFSDGNQKEIETMIASIYKGWVLSFGSSGLSAAYTYGNGSVIPNINPTGSFSGGELPVVGQTDSVLRSGVADSAVKMLDAGLRALETNNRGKVLAAPSVAAVDGQKASVKLTHNYLYQSGVDHNNNPEFSEQQTGPTLEFIPTVGRDGYITIKMKISTGEIVSFRKTGNSEAPETTVREVNTQIRVRNGEMFVIGGLYQENRTKSVLRSPIIGYIPLIGELFTSRTYKKTKSQVAFIAIPYILDAGDSEFEKSITEVF